MFSRRLRRCGKQLSLVSKTRRLSAREISARVGATAVEFALVASLLFGLFMTAFEFCRASMIRHMLDNAVYEAARKGIVPGATGAEVAAEAKKFLDTLGIRNAQITLSPSVINDSTKTITLKISVPMEKNSFVPPSLLQDKSISRQITMTRERAY